MNDERIEEDMPERRERGGGYLMGAGLATFLVATAFFSGYHFGTSNSPLEASLGSLLSQSDDEAPSDVSLDEFWRVWNLMEDKFVAGTTTDSLTPQIRLEGAIQGLVASYGDPYSVYLPPVEAASFEEDISGNFSGVGMEVGMRDNIITVIAPLPESPAEKAGIIPGDRIVKIDGEETDGMSIDAAVKRIRGEQGTVVNLTIYRDGESAFKEIAITRAIIDIPTIKTEVIGEAFVISLYNFNAISEMKMQEALREYVRSGKDQLVIDLRGNPGGFLQSAVAIASYFLPVGKVVVEESFGSEDKEDVVYRSSGKTFTEFSPENLVVLIDKGSASASEILAGALKAHGKATLIGETSFGKGSVQELVNLPGGSSLKVTVARWLTPDGTSISNGGLSPDIAVERTPQMVVENKDPQLDAAISFLKGEYVPPAPETASSTPVE